MNQLCNKYFKGRISKRGTGLINVMNPKEISMFDGFFGLLNYFILLTNVKVNLRDFLTLRSLSFSEKSIRLIDIKAKGIYNWTMIDRELYAYNSPPNDLR